MATSTLNPSEEVIFGSSPVEPKEIVSLLEKEITEDSVRNYCRPLKANPSQNETPASHNRPWTEAVFSILERDLVRRHGGRALFSVTQEVKSEFMLDFIWLSQSESGGYRDAKMGLECEWWRGLEALLRNFRKLLFFKAPLKVLIYSCSDGCAEAGRNQVREKLCCCIKEFNYHVEGEQYLLVEFVKKLENRQEDGKSAQNCVWEPEARVWRAEEHGSAEEVKLLGI